MNRQWKDYTQELIKTLQSTDYVKPHDIPNIDLYMDQVTSFMDRYLESSKRYDDDKLLTKTMINNYTKNELLPPPEKKKYSKDHMYLLVFIYYLKNFLSISDVKKIIQPMSKMFFNEKGGITLEEIYGGIFDIEEEMSYSLTKDVMRKFIQSKKSFSEVEGDEEREYLQMFSFIAMLSFDVYLKRNLIEGIIDDVLRNEDKKEKPEDKAPGDNS